MKRIIFYLVYFNCVLILAQELPPIQNFSTSDYGAQSQNWAISQSEDKLIYVANNEGLLEFNGANWKLYPSPNETIMRSVNVINNKIYTGCYMEFGFWKKNELGILEYTSLSKSLDVKLLQDEEFWNIIGIDDWVVFQSLNRIYIYHTKEESVSIIDSKETINKMFKVGQSIYFQRINRGIFKIENGKDTLIIDDELVKENEVINMFINNDALLLLTQNKGFYSFNDSVLTKWERNYNDYLFGQNIYNASRLRNKNLALGTISEGLLYLNEKGDLLYKFNQNSGLSNNTVLSVFEDVDNNIWLALDNGISYININAPLKIYKDKKGSLGSVYATAIHDKNLYLGTNQGLFYKKLDVINDEFKIVEGTQGQVWSLKLIDDILFCGHHKGTYVINNAIANRIADVPGTWNIDKLKAPNLLIQGNYDGLYVLEKEQNNWKLKNKIQGFNNSSRYFEVLNNKIFVNHEYKGIFKIKVDSSYSSVTNVEIDSSLKGANSGLAKYQNDILYAYKEGIFKYHSTQDEFIKDSLLSAVYSSNEYLSGRMVPDKQQQKIWLFTKSNITAVSPGELADVPKIKSFPITYKVRNNILEYENIVTNDEKNQYIIGTGSGYIAVNLNNTTIEDFEVFINSVSNGINDDHSAAENLVAKSVEGNFNNDENNLRISFYTPEYNKYFKPLYQFQLLGIYDVWSDWTNESNVFFENLPPGEYTFNVRARIGAKVSSNIAEYNFSIAKPWYISNVMLVVYGIGILLFSLLMHNAYKRYYNKQKAKLVEKNKREIELAKAKSEKEIIKIKNEQLQKDVKNKSKELAASTMSIVKKNELLTQIKEQLVKIKDSKATAPVITIIDKSLNHNDNWKLFKEAFDNADREFFKKLKKAHPNLSPSDLKLCAYLRLNLSSKEIAPLFNISARSVEIKRYRLRKKMDLSGNENLTNYIISL